MLKRPIPSTQETLPVIGLGTWQTFDVPAPTDRLQRTLETMHQAGGTLIDSSPMYGRSEARIGDLTTAARLADSFFYATKVWTTGREQGIRQMEESRERMQRETIDLMQIHNLTDWQTHLQTLREWKESKKIRYLGITHYTDSSHEMLERILATEAIDFVQFNYSILNRNAEKRLLSIAADRGVATLINRPLGEGGLFAQVRNQPLPAWAAAYEMKSWGQFFLKYIVSHPAVTCVIPGTSDPDHLADNMQAGFGPLPDEATRKKMVDYLTAL
ncbi:aldo/keto reductase [Siphonobacter sp. BAB-5405]|uniref:aldo/keto reductase n=1 Tax=Siphonobacter sp. BAB-5405 TaxID=1864825 RepID=UPI000C7FF48B|nr:aldo/keto reductase [Siphonobacter sp. BAB-5405]PMD91415.1 aldo/keto reductase [Siphonobacter sp. BAB-5405]